MRLLLACICVCAAAPLTMADEGPDGKRIKRLNKRGKGFTHRPDHRRTEASSTTASLMDSLRLQLAKLKDAFSPSMPQGGFEMTRGITERHTLIDYLWAGNYSDSTTEMLSANPTLSELLLAKTANSSYSPADKARFHVKREKRTSFLAGILARNRNVHILPKDQAILAITAAHKHVNHDFWEVLTGMRVLPSINWTNDLIDEALERNPGAPYETVQWVSAAVFDNNTTQCNYSARHNADTQGERLDMTNWATLSLPKSLMPHVDISRQGGDRMRLIFKQGFDKYSIIPLCHPLHPAITANKSRRWQAALAGIASGTYFRRPAYTPGYTQHMTYRPPIWDRLQSKNEDVEEEVRIMREHPAHRHSLIMFCGGDGLAIMRLNWTLARDYRTYLQSPCDSHGHPLPSLIPVQGEHPHGTCHVLHMGWRPYAPLVVGMLASIGHSECKKDFTVSSFNDHDHGMCILIEGVTRYFQLLESGGGGPCPLSMLVPFLMAVSINTDLSWLAHFLSDFGYLYWDMRQSVRSNDSAQIDLIWRECISFMHTDISHKTQYAPMAIMRIFWSNAMNPWLANIYHQHRTLSLLGLDGSNVGWDMPIEKENLMLNNVARPSKDRYESYIARLNFMAPVSRGQERLLMANRVRSANEMKSITDDVQGIVDHLVKTLGGTWQAALVPRDHANGKLVNPPRSPRPWEAVARIAASAHFDAWMRGHLDSKVPWM